MKISTSVGFTFALAALCATATPDLAGLAPPADDGCVEAPLTNNLLVMLQSEPSREEPRATGLCYHLRPQETLWMLVKGEPAIPQGGDILIAGVLGPGVEAGLPSNQTVYTGDGWYLLFQIPAGQPQEELLFVRNMGDTSAPACFRLAYQFAPERESRPEHKGGNEPSTRPIPPALPRGDKATPL